MVSELIRISNGKYKMEAILFSFWMVGLPDFRTHLKSKPLADQTLFNHSNPTRVRISDRQFKKIYRMWSSRMLLVMSSASCWNFFWIVSASSPLSSSRAATRLAKLWSNDSIAPKMITTSRHKKMTVGIFLNVCTPCGVRLLDHLLWYVFQSSHYKFQVLTFHDDLSVGSFYTCV